MSVCCGPLHVIQTYIHTTFTVSEEDNVKKITQRVKEKGEHLTEMWNIKPPIFTQQLRAFLTPLCAETSGYYLQKICHSAC